MGLRAGCDAFDSFETRPSHVIALAGDVPFARPTIDALCAMATNGDVAVAIDASGRRQNLVAVWPLALLRHQLQSVRIGDSVGSIFADVPTLTVASGSNHLDVNTSADLAAAQSVQAEQARPARPKPRSGP